jgi:hypothetical protein
MPSSAAYRPVVVAVAIVHMMEVAVDDVVDVVAVGHRIVTAALSMHVASRVAAACVAGRARLRVVRVYRDRAFIDMVAVNPVKVAVVHVVDMAVMLDGAVTAGRAMDVAVVGMDLMSAHRSLSFQSTAGTSARPAAPPNPIGAPGAQGGAVPSMVNRWTGVTTASSVAATRPCSRSRSRSERMYHA